jgi:hypothetical protein
MPSSTWPTAGVMIALILIVGAIAVAAVVRYTADDALRIWTVLDPLVGVIVGAAGTYWFARQTTEEARRKADALEQLARKNNLL